MNKGGNQRLKLKQLSPSSVMVELTGSRSGYKFLLEEQARAGGEVQLKVTSPNSEGIMYGTEEGNNNADYILLIKNH